MSTRESDVAVTSGLRNAASPPMIVAETVSKSYGNTHALSDVSLEVASGEILGLVGHNGAGKSTLMRLLAGRERPDSGSVNIRDVPTDRPLTPQAAEAAGVRMVY